MAGAKEDMKRFDEPVLVTRPRERRKIGTYTEASARVLPLEFPQHGDARGQLIALETLSAQIPFEVKRCYYIFDTVSGIDRGRHAHKALRQLLICVSGGCTIECETPDGRVCEYRLDWPNKGLLIEGLVWRVMRQFTKGAVLMVLASEHYDERDYIRDYETFKAFCRERAGAGR